jgi:hypothetical protein
MRDAVTLKNERLRKIYRVIGLVPIVMVVVGLLGIDSDAEHFSGPVWAVAVIVGGAALFGVLNAIQAWVERSLSNAVTATSALFSAFLISTPHGAVERPSWLAASSVVLLTLTFAGAVPLLVHLLRSQKDERERSILGAASAIAFGVVMVVVGAFSIYDQFSTLDAPRLTPTWILLIGVVSWTSSFAALRSRM